MPNIEEYCEVRTDGGTYRNWTEVSVGQSFEQGWLRRFRLTCAEPSKGLLRLKPGDRVAIALAGQVVIDEGYIINRQAAYDPTRHGVQIDGASKAWPLENASIDLPGGGQFQGYTLEAIANAVLKPHGLKFRLENPPDGANEKFPNAVVEYGETPFDMISRLCRQRALWIRADADGTVVAGAKEGSTGIQFTEGRNILAARSSINLPAAQAVISNSQQKGADSLFGRKASEIQARTTMSGGIPGSKVKVLAEMPLSQKELQLRTNMEAQAIQSGNLEVSLTYKGWLNPNGKLWDLTEGVTVKSPMLFPTESEQMELKLFGYEYTQDAGGSATTLALVNEGAFRVRYPDGQKSDGFYTPTPPAQPEVAT